MSDNKTNNQNNGQNGGDMQALIELLSRLERRDEVYRQHNIPVSRPAEPEEIKKPVIRHDTARFQPNNLSETDLGVLLLTEDAEDTFGASATTLIAMGEEDDAVDEGNLPAPPSIRRNPFEVLWGGFRNNLPNREDDGRTKARKCGFLTSLLVMFAAIVYLLFDLVVIPQQNDKLKQDLIQEYHPEKSEVVITEQEAEEGNYPENMLASFTDLYDRNDEVRGWITFQSTDEKKILDINYPIVYSGDNEKYLKKDFDGNKNRNGTLFFDARNQVDNSTDKNDVLIVYGHNMASGQMFAGLNKLLGSVNNARHAATLTMSTLFREDKYKVFAVVLIDESDKNERSYDMWKTSFSTDVQFLKHVDEIRARSLFDYNDVDVTADDQLLVLSTCTGKSSAHVKNGRLLVVARRVRDGESVTVNTSSIVKNSDVIMPYYWYVNQNKTPHKFYRENGLDTVTTQSTGDPTKPVDSTESTVGTTGTGSAVVTDPTESTTGSSTESSRTESTDSTTQGTQSEVTTNRPSSSTSSTTEPTQTKPTAPTQTTPSTSQTKPTTCKHDYKGTVVKQPTCTEYGETKHVCQLCGNQYTEKTMPIDHSFSGKCGSKCNTCDERLQHKWNGGVVLEAATCNKQGRVLYTCTVCGTEHEDRSQHDAGDSDPVAIRKEPCVESGEAWYKCQDCGELFLKDIPPVGYHIDEDGDGHCAGCG